MGFSTVIFAYLGPETMLPVTSAVAGLVGVLMMFGKSSFRRVIRIGRGLAAMIGRGPKPGLKARRGIGTGPVGRVAARQAKRETSA